MPVESAADLAAFTNPDEFGKTASYTLAAGGAPVPLNGVFDNAFAELDPGGEVPVSGRRPVFTVNTVDLPAGYGPDDILEIDAKTFHAVDHEPDETEDQTMIILELQ